MLTILVGKDGKTTANFALVQPSLQVDLPKILTEICRVAGGTPPRLDELAGMPARMRGEEAPALSDDLRSYLRPLIRKDATVEQVDAAAKRVEEYMAANESGRKQIVTIAQRIVDSGRLTNYGTERAQEYLRKWAKEPAEPEDKAPGERR
jgi:hypothetical protein